MVCMVRLRLAWEEIADLSSKVAVLFAFLSIMNESF